jgi:tol-pal system protein YbgF
MQQLRQQSPSKGEVQDLEAQMGRQMENLLRSEADMQVQLKDLSAQIDQLRAQLEDTNYRLAQVSQQIAATNQELRAFRETAARQPAEGTGAPGLGPAATPARPEELYQASYQDYTQGNYDLAVRGFQEYLRSFPDTDLSDNATYWIGECHYRQRLYRRAIEQFDRVLRDFPRSDKTASAVLKKGYALIELGERAQGISELRRVVREHPTSDEANLARQRLRELGVDAR